VGLIVLQYLTHSITWPSVVEQNNTNEKKQCLKIFWIFNRTTGSPFTGQKT